MSSSSLNSSQKQLFEQQPQQAGSFIDRQLQRATAQVRLVDLLGGFLIWGSATLGFLLALAVVDAWIYPLSVPVRLAALVLIVGASLAYLIRSLWPLVTRRINPMYAAKMLEEGQPGLKNSLVNFLSFRESPSLARKRVLEAMANKAAIDLSSLPIETTVDRGKLIRFGYLLVGLVAICAGYMVLSPKSPLVTVGRIVAPLADVPPPARVKISNIEPGDMEVTFGDPIEVHAEVEGLGRDELVELLFTTEDRQRVDESIPMTLDESRGVYSAELRTGTRGVEHSLVYHVRAGDARSSHFRVDVRQSATATIEQVELLPPAYTELPSRQQTQGDIEGVEGTEIILRGKANFPLQAAVLELLRPGDGASDRGDPSRKPAKRIKMNPRGDEFEGRFKLELSDDRLTPLYSDYRIALLTEDQQTNANPTHYRISVFPDMAPEVQWIRPQESEIELPVNGRLPIETRAIDRDFAIQRVVLRGDHQGRQVLGEELLDSSRRPDDQHLGKYNLRPAQLGLAPGDTLVLHVVAEDNRCHPQSGLPDPNSARTENVTVRVTGHDPRAESGDAGSGGQSAAGAPSEESGDSGESTTGQAGESNTGSGQESGTDESSDQGTSENQTQSGSSDQSEGENTEGSESSNQGQGSGTSGADAGTQTNQEQRGGAGNTTAGGESAEQQENEARGGGGGQESSDPAQPGGQTSSGGGNSPTTPDGATPPPTNEAGGGDSNGGGTTGGAADPRNAGDPQSGGADDSTDTSGGEGTSDSGDAPHEGEVFEKILEHMKNQQKQNQTGATEPAGQQDSGEPSDSGTDQQPQTDETGSQQPGTENSAAGQSRTGDDPSAGQPSSPTGEQGSTTGSDRSDAGQTGEGSSRENGSGQSGESEQGTAGDNQPQRERQQGAGEDTSADPSGSAASDNSSQAQPSSGGASAEQASDNTGAAQSTGDQSSTASQTAGQDDTGSGSESTTGQPNDATGGQSTQPESGNEADAGESTDAADESTTGGSAGNQGAGSQQPGSQQPESRNDPRASDSGTPGQGSREGGQSSQTAGELPEGEKANLEYSRRATDLVLDYLRDQEQQPDPELLAELNWTERDLDEFLTRWEAMRKAAGEGSTEAQSRLTNRIRSLGLMPQRSGVGNVQARNDDLTGITQDGAKSTPPPEFAEKFRLFLKGAAQAESTNKPAPR